MANEASRARAGATFLDTNCVGWPEKIDEERLSLNSCDNCVLGQVFDEHYYHVRLRLGLAGRQCAELGFCSELWVARDPETQKALSPEARATFREAVSDEYLALRSAWIAEIEARMEEARIEATPVDAGCVWGAL